MIGEKGKKSVTYKNYLEFENAYLLTNNNVPMGRFSISTSLWEYIYLHYHSTLPPTL